MPKNENAKIGFEPFAKPVYAHAAADGRVKAFDHSYNLTYKLFRDSKICLGDRTFKDRKITKNENFAIFGTVTFQDEAAGL